MTGSNASWAIARACCTVAKRPLTSFEGSNALAAGSQGFVTTRYTRMFTQGGTKYLFGSWSEYALMGKVKTNSTKYGTASGATYGYATGNGGVDINATRSNDGNVATGSNAKNVCVFSTQTFVNNASCANTSNNIGAQNIGTTSASQFATNFKNRYTADAPTKTINTNSLSCVDLSSAGSSTQCVTINGQKYAYLKNAMATTSTGDILYNKVIGNAYLDTVVRTGKQTTIYDVSGTFIINSNVVTTTSETEAYPSYDHANKVRQNLIFANNVHVLPNVEKIDALVIADNEVDTCAYSSTDNLKNGTRTALSNLNANLCNKQLVFNAPVITRKINLFRTFGASNDTSSIKRAEIFDFDMANYLWTYGQASKYSQANTTYTRELPPRY